MEKSRRFATGSISIRTGSEGPKYDPYSFTEYTVERRNNKVTLHLGLAVWFRDQFKTLSDQITEQEAVERFERFAGISLKTFEHAMHRVIPCCDNPDIRWWAGYPGEEIAQCENCKKVVDSSFDIGAVI